MKIISHRGNLHGANSERENSPGYIDEAIAAGFDVEVDVWFIDGHLFLGHDAPTHPVCSSWIAARRNSLWLHAKNIDALATLKLGLGVRVFWHENDRMTLTSEGMIWMYPGNYSPYGITVELGEAREIPFAGGVCTDHPVSWRERRGSI